MLLGSCAPIDATRSHVTISIVFDDTAPWIIDRIAAIRLQCQATAIATPALRNFLLWEVPSWNDSSCRAKLSALAPNVTVLDNLEMLFKPRDEFTSYSDAQGHKSPAMTVDLPDIRMRFSQLTGRSLDQFARTEANHASISIVPQSATLLYPSGLPIPILVTVRSVVFEPPAGFRLEFYNTEHRIAGLIRMFGTSATGTWSFGIEQYSLHTLSNGKKVVVLESPSQGDGENSAAGAPPDPGREQFDCPPNPIYTPGPRPIVRVKLGYTLDSELNIFEGSDKKHPVKENWGAIAVDLQHYADELMTSLPADSSLPIVLIDKDPFPLGVDIRDVRKTLIGDDPTNMSAALRSNRDQRFFDLLLDAIPSHSILGPFVNPSEGGRTHSVYALVIGNVIGETCGASRRIRAQKDSAWLVVKRSCIGAPNYGLLHELGHLLGARHQPWLKSCAGVTEFSRYDNRECVQNRIDERELGLQLNQQGNNHAYVHEIDSIGGVDYGTVMSTRVSIGDFGTRGPILTWSTPRSSTLSGLPLSHGYEDNRGVVSRYARCVADFAEAPTPGLGKPVGLDNRLEELPIEPLIPRETNDPDEDEPIISNEGLARMVYFKSGEATPATGTESLTLLAKSLARAKIRTVWIDGFTDTTAKELMNLTLSENRATSVAKVLRDALPGLITLCSAHGKDARKLAELTKDEVRSPRNRRAEVRWRESCPTDSAGVIGICGASYVPCPDRVHSASQNQAHASGK